MGKKERLQNKIKDTEKQIEQYRKKLEKDETNFNAVLTLESLLRFKKNLEEELEDFESDD